MSASHQHGHKGAKAGKWGDQRPRTFNEAVDRFIDDHMPMLKPSSRTRYVVSIRNLLDTFDGVSLADISTAQLKSFESRRRRDGVSTSTIRRDLACLSSIFSLAEEEEWVTTNPVKAFLRARKKRGLVEAEPRKRYLSHDEEEALLATATAKSKQAIAFAIDTGLRKDEQFSLRWTDVDLVDNWITVRAENTKSNRSRRVPILPRTKAILREMARAKLSLFVFTSSTGTRYSKTSPTMYNALQKACRRASITEHVEWHDLRRTCGCRLLNDHGYSMAHVSLWLGHSRIGVTERTYAFLEAERLQDRIDRTPSTIVSIDLPKSDEWTRSAQNMAHGSGAKIISLKKG